MPRVPKATSQLTACRRALSALQLAGMAALAILAVSPWLPARPGHDAAPPAVAPADDGEDLARLLRAIDRGDLDPARQALRRFPAGAAREALGRLCELLADPVANLSAIIKAARQLAQREDQPDSLRAWAAQLAGRWRAERADHQRLLEGDRHLAGERWRAALASYEGLREGSPWRAARQLQIADCRLELGRAELEGARLAMELGKLDRAESQLKRARRHLPAGAQVKVRALADQLTLERRWAAVMATSRSRHQAGDLEGAIAALRTIPARAGVNYDVALDRIHRLQRRLDQAISDEWQLYVAGRGEQALARLEKHDNARAAAMRRHIREVLGARELAIKRGREQIWWEARNAWRKLIRLEADRSHPYRVEAEARVLELAACIYFQPATRLSQRTFRGRLETHMLIRLALEAHPSERHIARVASTSLEQLWRSYRLLGDLAEPREQQRALELYRLTEALSPSCELARHLGAALRRAEVPLPPPDPVPPELGDLD